MAMKNVIAGDTLLWERREKNVVYMLSEFIDNSKAAYEDVLNGGNEIIDELPIDLTFDQQKGLISVTDKGKGFDILEAIEKIGNNEVKLGKTNQYFVGMKSALNYFGDYSILVSERKIDGEYKRFCNFLVFKEGLNDFDIELEPEMQTGSSVIMFENHAAAKAFWMELKFKRNEDRHLFPEEPKKDPTNYPVTSQLLSDIKTVFPYIAASLFQRYTPLVKKYRDIVLNFQCFDHKGYSLLLDNSNGIASYDNSRPEWLKAVKRNSFDEMASLSFEEFREKNKGFYNKMENDPAFRKDWQNFFTELIGSDYRKYFTELSKDFNSYDLTELGRNFELKNDPSTDLETKISVSYLDKYPFAKIFGDAFVTMFMAGKGTLSDFKFVMHNMTINKSHIIEVNTFSDNANVKTFDIGFNWNIASDTFHDKNYEKRYGKYSVNQITGFRIVQNDRAIYNGPNFDSVHFSGQEYPHNLLLEQLREKDPKFKNSWTAHSGTKPGEGGNVYSYTAGIFGLVELSNDENFSSGTNKSQISNLDIFTNYLVDAIAKSGIAVLAKWANLLKNRFDTSELLDEKSFRAKVDGYKAQPTSKCESPIDAYARDVAEREVKNTKSVDDDGRANVTAMEQKVASLPAAQRKAIDALVESRMAEEKDDTPVDNLANAVKHIENKLREMKKNDVISRSVNTVTSDAKKYEISISLKGKTGRATQNWNKSVLIILNDNDDENVTFDLDDELPIKINFPVVFKKYDDQVLREKIDTFLKNLISSLVNAGGFYAIAKAGLKTKMPDIKIGEAVEAYLWKQLDGLNGMFDNE